MSSKGSLDSYMKIEKVGEGTFGTVFKGKHKKTGKTVAMKKIHLENEEKGIPSTAIREITLLKELKHPNIVTLEEVIMEDTKFGPTKLCLIFEFLPMDLKQHLDSLSQKGEFMHPKLVKRSVLHRDLKSQNILFDDEKGTIKLADFGLGRAIRVPVHTFTHEVVTLFYRAPEVLLGSERYSMPVDVWSMGCIFAEMATNQPLFRGSSEIDQLFKIFRVLGTPTEETWLGVTELEHYNPSFPQWMHNNLATEVQNITPDGMELLQSMLVYDPANRISAKKMLDHVFFDDLDKTSLPAAHVISAPGYFPD